MAAKTFIGVQPYLTGPKGKPKKGVLVPAANAEEANRRAQRGVESGAFVGAVVFSVDYDDKSDYAEEPVFIASFGQVPDMATA